MNASMMYIGDHLELYKTLRMMCSRPSEPGQPLPSVSTDELANETGFHRRWLKEWLAQQAGMGLLTLIEESAAGDGTPDDE